MLAGAGLLYYLSYFDRGFKPFDEGNLVEPAMRVLAGDMPYRDFDHVYAPGRFYLFALIFKLFGPDLLAVRYTWVAVHVAGGVLTYLTARKISSPLFSMVASALAVFAPGVWHKSFFVFLPVVFTYVAFRCLDRPTRAGAFVAGLVCASAFIFRQDVGVYCAIAFVTVLVWLRVVERLALVVKDTALFLAGVSAVIVPFMLSFYFHGALEQTLWNLFVAGREGVTSNALPFPALRPLWSGSVSGTLADKLFYLPFLVYGAGVAVLIGNLAAKGRDGSRRYMLFLVVLGLLVLMQVKYRSDASHLWQVMPLVMIMAAGLFDMLAGALAKPGREAARYVPHFLALLLVAWVGSVAIAEPASGSIAARRSNTCLLDEQRARVYVPQEICIELTGVLEFLRRNVSEEGPFLVAPDVPMIYFLAGQKNPVRRGIFRLGLTSSEDTQRDVIKRMQDEGVELVVLNKWEINDRKPERSFANHSKILYGYIRENYHTVYDSPMFEVRQRDGKTEGE